MKSLFEEMGGTYRKEGDYLIPNLTLTNTGNYQLGKYGRMRRTYLKEHRKVLYTNLVTKGTLFKHLRFWAECISKVRRNGLWRRQKLTLKMPE